MSTKYRVMCACVAGILVMTLCATSWAQETVAQQDDVTDTANERPSDTADETRPDIIDDIPLDTKEQPSVYEYETVVVAERQPEDPFEANRSVTLIDAVSLQEHAPRTVPEALWEAPGVFVQQTNHGGGSPIVRGMIGPQNLILIDGVRFNNSVYRTGPIQYLNLIDSLSLERIEVLRGPGSVLYGSDAMGGVIQAVTLSPDLTRDRDDFESGGQGLLRYGSADRQRTNHLHLYGGYQGFSLLGGATYKAFEDLTGGRGIGEQQYTGYDVGSVIGNLSYQLNDGAMAGSRLSLLYLMSRMSDAGRTDKLLDSHSLQLYDNDDDFVYARFHSRIRPIDTAADVTVSYQHFFERKDTLLLEEDLLTERRRTRDEVTVNTLGLDLELTTWLMDHRLRLQYGGMWYQDWVGADQLIREAHLPWETSNIASFPDDSSFSNFGGFVLAEGDLVSSDSGHNLRANAGYRLHGSSADAPERDSLEAVDFSYLGHVFYGGLQYLFRTDATVGVSFSQGFRAPNLNEAVMLGDTGKYFHIPNSDLDPERSDTFELLARGRLGPITAGCAGYVSLLHDLIRREETTWEGQSEVDGKAVARNVNGGEGLLWGIEGELAWAIGYGFSIAGHINSTWGEEDITEEPDVPLTRIPPLFGQAALRYDTREALSWHGFIETYVRIADRQDRLSPEDERDVRIPEGGTPGWWTWNIRAGLVAYDHLQLNLTVENLLNEAYKYHGSGLYSPGTNAVLTVSGFY